MWSKRRKKGNVVSALLLDSDLASVFSENLFVKRKTKKIGSQYVSFIFHADPAFPSAALCMCRRGREGWSREN